MMKIELECKHCGTQKSVEKLPFRLGNWLIHRGKDVFCSLDCVMAYTNDLRLKMQEEAREEDRRIVWSPGSSEVATPVAGTISGNRFSNVEGQGTRVPPERGGGSG